MAEENTPQNIGNAASTPTASPSPKKPSAILYIFPILLGFIGGIIGYFVVRKQDPKMARNLLIVGIVISVLMVVLNVVMNAASWLYISSYYG